MKSTHGNQVWMLAKSGYRSIEWQQDTTEINAFRPSSNERLGKFGCFQLLRVTLSREQAMLQTVSSIKNWTVVDGNTLQYESVWILSDAI
ncbi:hypothetical protein LRAMOSA01133 [Lichtheimia ramosa]|uniref:Uncharacterized protein n=1 Tax=Lichtheimia ramosa TaxID=688394 RepID=A0A077W8P2_9FUNG|nr:hypothetical protein LRAMOSA01133 [Lichtheimia ramosa]